MKSIRNALPLGLSLLCSAAPLFAQDMAPHQGYWAGGYGNGQGGEIQFQLTIIDNIAELKYDATNWGALGFAMCEYLFPLENGAPGTITRNSGAGTGECLEAPSFTLTRANKDSLSLVFSNPEIGLDTVDLAGILRPFDPAEAHAPVAGLDILGIAPGMNEAAITQALSAKGYSRQPQRDRITEYEGFTIDQLVWTSEPVGDDEPLDWIFATFTAKKEWATDQVPVATYIGRDWDIPDEAGISGSTMIETLVKKYGAASNTINEDRLYDRTGAVLIDSYGCPEGPQQSINYEYQLKSEVGNENAALTCGPVLKGYVGTDSSTGRAVSLKLRLTDPDPLWDDFWQTWSHGEYARLRSVYDGVTGATGSAPEL